MDLTHEALLSLGFTELVNRPSRYIDEGVIGRLQAETGTFHVYGFNPPVEQLTDLRYMMKIIVYNYQATIVPYPSHFN